MTQPTPRLLIALAGLNGFLAVAAGSFGAHGVQDEGARTLLKTAAEYQLGAAGVGLALLALAALKGARLSAGLVLVGGLVFATTIDLIVVTGNRLFGAVTPIGGVLMLAGFGWLVVSALRHRDS